MENSQPVVSCDELRSLQGSLPAALGMRESAFWALLASSGQNSREAMRWGKFPTPPGVTAALVERGLCWIQGARKQSPKENWQPCQGMEGPWKGDILRGGGERELERPLPVPSHPLQAQPKGRGGLPLSREFLGSTPSSHGPPPRKFRSSRTSRVCEPACFMLLGRAK